MSELHRQSIIISDLRLGMFVVDLDIPWIDSPFLTHNRRIKSEKDIDALKRCGVKHLVIDVLRGASCCVPSKSTGSHLPDTSTDDDTLLSCAPSIASQLPNNHDNASSAKQIVGTTLNAEMIAAKQVRAHAHRVVGDLLDSFDAKTPINIESLGVLVDETLASLTRNNQALMSLAHISRKSQKLADHTFSTYCLALNIGVQQGSCAADLHTLGLAALLHEAGWVCLPLSLMGKRTPYTVSERKLIRSHIDIGIKTLQSSNLSPHIIRVIEEHHERLDGSGYPHKKKACDIHPLSKILAIADSYDERVHQLEDKPGVLPRNAIQSLYKEAKAGMFDASLMTLFVAALGVYPVSSAVLLSSGECGVVIDNNAAEHHVTVRVYYDKAMKPLEPFDVVVAYAKCAQAGVNTEATQQNTRQIVKHLDPSNSRDDPFGLLVLEG